MGIRNYLIDGASGTGKTTVATELQRRGYHIINGDDELACRGDPETGVLIPEPVHASALDKAQWHDRHHIWDLNKVKAIDADQPVDDVVAAILAKCNPA